MDRKSKGPRLIVVLLIILGLVIAYKALTAYKANNKTSQIESLLRRLGPPFSELKIKWTLQPQMYLFGELPSAKDKERLISETSSIVGDDEARKITINVEVADQKGR